jgi:hypothetical protein
MKETAQIKYYWFLIPSVSVTWNFTFDNLQVVIDTSEAPHIWSYEYSWVDAGEQTVTLLGTMSSFFWQRHNLLRLVHNVEHNVYFYQWCNPKSDICYRSKLVVSGVLEGTFASSCKLLRIFNNLTYVDALKIISVIWAISTDQTNRNSHGTRISVTSMAFNWRKSLVITVIA